MGCSNSKQRRQSSKTFQHVTRWDSMTYDDEEDDVMSLNRLFDDVDDRANSPDSVSECSSKVGDDSSQKAHSRGLAGVNDTRKISEDKKVRFETKQQEVDDTCLLQNYEKQELIEKKRRSFQGDMHLYRQATGTGLKLQTK